MNSSRFDTKGPNKSEIQDLTKLPRYLSFTLLAVSVIISVLLGFISLYESRRITSSEAKKHLKVLLEKSAIQIENRIGKAEFFSNYLSRITSENLENLNDIYGNEKKQKDLENRLKDQFLTAINATGANSAWAHFDPQTINGVVHVSYYRKDKKINQGGRFDISKSEFYQDDWFQKALSDGFYWTKPYHWKYWDERVITYSRAVLVDGKSVGVVGNDFYMDDIFNELSKVRIYESGTIILVNENFDVLFHPDQKIQNLRSHHFPPNSEIPEVIHSSDKPFDIIEHRENNTDKLLAYQKLSNGWILLTEPSTSEMFAAQNNLSHNLLLILLIGILVSICISFYLGKAIASPIIQLYNELIQKNKELSRKNHEIESQKKELDFYANYDALTGIANRRAGIMYLNQRIESACKLDIDLTIAFIDINNLKTVNDTLGHEEGDRLIKFVADTISSFLTKEDMVARLGGDELLMILWDCREKDAIERIHKIETSIQEKNSLSYPVTFSYGTETYPTRQKEKIDIEEFIKIADEKMYVHKKKTKKKLVTKTI